MRMIRDILRLRLEAGLSERQAARSAGVPRSTVQDYVARFRASGLPWPLAATLEDVALEQALFACERAPVATGRPLPDWACIAQVRISADGDHPFRLKPITCFAPSRSPISLEVDHRVS